MSEPFTIQIFVPDGNPDNIVLVDRINWTGLGLRFSRTQLGEAMKRKEFDKPGIYILIGEPADDQEGSPSSRPRLYIGQAENLRNRLGSHNKQKDFWDRGVAFVASNDSLNRGHLLWLEHALIQKARSSDLSQLQLDNNQMPVEPHLSESDKAGTQAFLNVILQILPLMNLHVFTKTKPIIPKEKIKDVLSGDAIDTIVVPAQEEGFNRVFLGENCWWAIRIAAHMVEKLKYIAAYQTSPISAITYVAPIKQFEHFGNEGKYKVIFAEKANPIGPIPFGKAPKGAMQGLRYTSLEKLKKAKSITDL